MQYLNKARIREAQRTLQSTDFPVNNVAAQTVFTNASHFARIYKKYTGITPSQEIKKALHSRQNKPNWLSISIMAKNNLSQYTTSTLSSFN